MCQVLDLPKRGKTARLERMKQVYAGVFRGRRPALQTEIADWKRQVERRLERVFQEYPSQLPIGTPEVKSAIRLLREFTLRAASKRVRAYLVRLGYESRSARVPQGLIDVAAAVELIQTYLLIHDDIIDRDEVRRGGPTVHAALRAQLTVPVLERRRLSNSLALLIGDLAFSWAMRLVSESPFPAERRLRALRVLLTTHETCVGGQYLDVLPVSEISLTRERVEAIARRKTASYTFVGPLCAGAYLAGASETTIRALSAYGESVGMAYQWIDDLDDVLALKQGARSSNDLDEGKGTAVVIATRKLLRPSERRRFDALLRKVPKTPLALRRLTRYVHEAKVEKMVRAEAAHFVQRGIRALASPAALRSAARGRLREVSHFILGVKTE